jgi:hypothetical protein
MCSLLGRVSRGASAAAPVQCRRSRATTVVAKAALQALIFDCDGKWTVLMSLSGQLACAPLLPGLTRLVRRVAVPAPTLTAFTNPEI